MRLAPTIPAKDPPPPDLLSHTIVIGDDERRLLAHVHEGNLCYFPGKL